MIAARFSIICLSFAIHGEALTFSRNGRLIPNVKIAEEIDIGDVTFTTPPSADSTILATARTKPRVIVPVVTYHKVNHPPQYFALHGGASFQHEKRNRAPESYKNSKLKKWKIVPLTKGGNFFLTGNNGKVYLKPTKYRVAYPHRNIRPVYYLLGDDPAPSLHANELGGNKPGESGENIKTHLMKNHHPKKYSSPKEHSFREEEDVEEEETLSSVNSESSQMMGNGEEMKTKAGDRVEFQMYGMNGPNSYKFGYDTGKGDNRHFRFEERDSEGKIRGHYGYMDNEGKMRIMKYEADPETGFHAGPVDYTPNQN